MRIVALLAFCLLQWGAIVDALAADAYPVRALRLIVPFPPGGPADALARLIGDRLSVSLGKAVVVDNRPGAGGNIGMELGAKSAPDGYTLVLAPAGNLTVNPFLYRSVPYDVARDFAPVTVLASVPNVLVVHPALATKTVAELIRYAKAHPGTLNYSSPGNGSGAHLAGEAFFDQADIKVNHIPFNGIGASVTAAVGGNVDMIIGYPIAIMPQVAAGKLLPIAQFSAERSPLLPDVPTLKETGVDLVIDIHTGVFAPKRTPDAIVARLSDAFKIAAEAPGFKSFGEQSWTVPFYRPTAEFAHEIEPEKTMYDKVIARLGAR